MKKKSLIKLKRSKKTTKSQYYVELKRDLIENFEYDSNNSATVEYVKSWAVLNPAAHLSGLAFRAARMEPKRNNSRFDTDLSLYSTAVEYSFYCQFRRKYVNGCWRWTFKVAWGTISGSVMMTPQSPYAYRLHTKVQR